MPWLQSLFRRREREEALDRELRFHLEEQIRDNFAAGMNPEQARREALLEFGGIERVKDECREVSRAGWLDALRQDVKLGLRSLGRSPGFTVTALATIALGIGFNAAIYSYLDGILFRSDNFPDADRLVSIYESGRSPQHLVSTLNFLDLAEQSTAFEFTSAQRWGWVTLTGSGLPTQVYCESVGVHYQDIFSVPYELGRKFTDGDDQKGRDHVVVINHTFWQTQFGGDPHIVGRPILLDGEPYTVIGVSGKGLADLSPAKMCRPLVFTERTRNREQRWLLAWGKLKPGVTMEQARAQIETIGLRLKHDYPAANGAWKLQMEPAVADRVPEYVKQSLYLLMAAVGLVMLIACANLANLTLARGAVRAREVAVRAALGASRSRLVRQFLTESLLLSAGGGTLGIGVAYASLAGLNRLVPSYYIPINKYVELDGRVLLFILGLAILTGLAFGIYPALKGSHPDLRHALSQGGLAATGGRSQQRFRQVLVVLEVALAVVLLFGGGLLIRTFAKLKQVETGVETNNVVTAMLPIDQRRFATQAALKEYLRRIADRLAALPGIRDAALTSGLPLRGMSMGLPYRIAGTKQDTYERGVFCNFKTVSSSYFRLIGLRLLRGRLLNDHDVEGSAPAIVINETMARRVFGDHDPIGQVVILPRLDPFSSGPRIDAPWEIVGVVSNELVGGLRANFQIPCVYVTTDQDPISYQALLVRAVIDPVAVQRSIPAAVAEVSPDQAVSDLRTLDDIKTSMIGKERLDSTVLGIFAAASLFLSALGLYGVISYSVAQRTREIGIRGALGATSGDILWMIFRGGFALIALGLAVGIIGAFGTGRLLASMLFQVDPFDSLTLGLIVVVQAGIAFLASFFPARKAVKVSPLVALRCE